VPLPPGPLVSGGWLAAHLGEVRVADVRWYLDGRSGRAAYEAGHIPTAVWVDLDHDLAGDPRIGELAAPGHGRHPLPDPERFAAALGRLGLDATTPVVAYDDASGSIAARLWWMLKTLGQPVAVLDGGLAAWSGPLVSGTETPQPVHRDPCPWPAESVVDTATVDRLRRDPSAVVLDARAPERYRGETEPIDARPGHIPGARNHPWTTNLDAGGRMLPADDLRRRLTEDGVGAAGGPIVSSCGSGVTACHNLLAMELAGLGGGVLYAGSWSAWAARPELPAAAGPDPG
jgi:thiosulfate/3-mercaptopyruvate sulfurtransferase